MERKSQKGVSALCILFYNNKHTEVLYGIFSEPKKIEEMKQQGLLVKQSAGVEAPLDRIPVFVRK